MISSFPSFMAAYLAVVNKKSLNLKMKVEMLSILIYIHKIFSVICLFSNVNKIKPLKVEYSSFIQQ